MPTPIESDTPVHDWFGLSYSSYLVIPRLALEQMPVEWQFGYRCIDNRRSLPLIELATR